VKTCTDDKEEAEKSEAADFEGRYWESQILGHRSDDEINFLLLKGARVTDKKLVVVYLAHLDALIVEHKFYRHDYHVAIIRGQALTPQLQLSRCIRKRHVTW
jgi:hypothetical protein